MEKYVNGYCDYPGNLTMEEYENGNFRISFNFTLHPDYNRADNFSQDLKKESSDIAIVFWVHPIKMREEIVQPICLPKNETINDKAEYAMMSGWGMTGQYDNSSGQPKEKQKIFHQSVG